MDKKTALEFIERIEENRTREAEIWDEMRGHPDYGMNEDKSVKDILAHRAAAAERLEMAEADLDAFDWVEVDGNFGGLYTCVTH